MGSGQGNVRKIYEYSQEIFQLGLFCRVLDAFFSL